MTLSIKTNTLKTRKQVEIDGHHYTVRKMGNIEQLDMAQYITRLRQLANLEKDGTLDEKKSTEVTAISKAISDMFINLFDDGGDQKKSRKLVSSLSDVEIGELLSQVFAEPEETLKPEETPSDRDSEQKAN